MDKMHKRGPPDNANPNSVLEDYFEILLHEQDEEDSGEPEASAAVSTPDRFSNNKALAPSWLNPSVPALAAQSLPKNLAPDDVYVLETHRREALQRLLSQGISVKVAEAIKPAPVSEKPVVEVKTEIKTVSKTEALAEIKTEIEAEIKEEIKVPQEIVSVPVSKSAIKTEKPVIAIETANKIDPLLHWGDNGRPLWAKDSFDILLFSVSGLTLAVPLVALGHIVDFSQDKLSYLQGRSSWFMGILPSSVGKLRIINTALFVMPEKYNENFLSTAEYVVTIHGLPWGLMVDSVKQPVRLQPDDVKWRSERSKRPWLAGTVKSLMCALIDIPQLADMLKNSQHKP